MKRSLLEETPGDNSTLILAAKRTNRKDPLNNLKHYEGGWNISNKHYISSVSFTAAPLFAIAAIWFIGFGLCLFILSLYYCCCRRRSYGYSRTAYALSLIFLTLFTVAAIIGCIVLYTGQGKFHSSTTNTLEYVVSQAYITGENLRNVSEYLDASKRLGVDQISLPAPVRTNIENIETKINDSASSLKTETAKNSNDIQNVLDSVRLALIIIAAVMLLLVFLGFLFSIFGLQVLVNILVIMGWILVAITFVLCGLFLVLHNVVADTCVAMDQWVEHPTARTALDDILPCVDNATAQETLSQSKDVTYQLVGMVNSFIVNVSNKDFPPELGPLYYNQSGPLVPVLCNPFNSDKTDRNCSAGEVSFNSGEPQDWKKFVCQVSSTGICTTVGRLTPSLYGQMMSAVNVSYALYRYGPFLVDLQDCSFVRETFSKVHEVHCPGLRRYSKWIYIGLVMVSSAVMLSLIFWVLYARERRHRVYTKQFIALSGQEHMREGKGG